jgi:hypothetical protein
MRQAAVVRVAAFVVFAKLPLYELPLYKLPFAEFTLNQKLAETFLDADTICLQHQLNDRSCVGRVARIQGLLKNLRDFKVVRARVARFFLVVQHTKT